LATVSEFDCKTVCVSGGEPLAQKACIDLLRALCDAGYSVSLETSGALDIGEVDGRVSRIMDIKAPDSGESDKNRWENIPLLSAHDEVKFVLASAGDYAWAVDVVKREKLADRCGVLFSPVQGQLSPTTLAEWGVRDRLPVRFQLQLHKILWGSERARRAVCRCARTCGCAPFRGAGVSHRTGDGACARLCVSLPVLRLRPAASRRAAGRGQCGSRAGRCIAPYPEA